MTADGNRPQSPSRDFTDGSLSRRNLLLSGTSLATLSALGANLRSDPFERGDESILYDKWTADRVFVQVPMQALAAKWLESFKEFPVRQKPAAFNLDQVMEKFEKAGAGAN